MSSKYVLAGVAAVTFTGGVLVASGLDLTPGGHAAVLQGAPTRQDVKPVADLSDAFISISESVTPAVVSIDTEHRGTRGQGRQGQVPEEFRRMFPQFRIPEDNAPQEARGSGFITTADGYIITNNHVVQGATKIDVVLQDNRHMQARIVGADPLTDIAVIKVEARGLPTVRLGSSEGARIGEWVLAIGNPLDLGTTVTSGIISAKGRALPILRQTSGSNWAIEDFIQTDAPINPGNSGGPLVNLRGEVVGVNSAIASPTGYYSGYGFAVPINLARRVADDLVKFGVVHRPMMGVQIRDVTTADAEVFRLPSPDGAVVSSDPTGAARDAGMQMGDVIVAIQGQPVKSRGDLMEAVMRHAPGDAVRVDYVRYGSRRSATLRLTQMDAARTAVRDEGRPEESSAADRVGFRAMQITPDVAAQLRMPNARGVVITGVDPAGPSAAQVFPGLIIERMNGREIQTIAELRSAIDALRPGQVVSITGRRPDGAATIVNFRARG